MAQPPASGDPAPAPAPATPSNRRFWYVAVPVLVAAVVVVTGALLTRPDTSYREGGPQPRQNLRQALRTADIVRDKRGSYADATPDELAAIELTLAFVPGDRSSTRPEEISVMARDGLWAAAARGARDSCYVLRAVEGGAVIEGVIDPGSPDTPCSADAAAEHLVGP